MQSLIRLISGPDNLSIRDDIVNILDLTRLDNIKLLQISDCSKLAPDELDTLALNTNEIELFQKMIQYLSLEDLKSIEFDKFSDQVKQSYLSIMLWNNIQTDMVCILLDQMKSVNYGKYTTFSFSQRSEINPLRFCCYRGNFNLVKLLVEKYNADIEHPSGTDMTGIMWSARCGHKEITSYLYDRGARLETSTQHIDEFATDAIKQLIAIKEYGKKYGKKYEVFRVSATETVKSNCDQTVEDEKLNQYFAQESETLDDLDQIKADYLKLKLENDQLKSNYQAILNLLHKDSM